jgi:glycosyltransferase involved in cell wall biosynthesis
MRRKFDYQLSKHNGESSAGRFIYANGVEDGDSPRKTSPLISIVTPSFNQASFISEAVESVRLQNYPNLEHLIMDGSSTDGTVEILSRLAAEEKYSHLKWLSEPDEGQSAALNKGFGQAHGEIIGWLNSDDRYRAGCFERVVQAFESNCDVDILYGDYTIVDKVGKVISLRPEIEFSSFILFHHHVSYIPTTATFFRRRIFEEGNLLKENLHYAMDYELFVRLAARGYRFKHLPAILADFRLQSTSKTCSAPHLQLIEHQQIVRASSPIARRFKSKRLQLYALKSLRAVAAVRRYTEKLLRGHYLRQVSFRILYKKDVI